MTQQELDDIPEIGLFGKEPVPGMPGCYRPVPGPVYTLFNVTYCIDSYGVGWITGWHERKKWKRRV